MKEPQPSAPEAEASNTLEVGNVAKLPKGVALQGEIWDPVRAREQRWKGREFMRAQQPAMGEEPPWDDTKTFLASFEQVAQACRWPKGEWAARLLPALSGEAEQAFRSLDAGDREDFGKVKAAVLRADAQRMEAQRQHFRHFRCQAVEDPQRVYSQVQELCRRWLKPERRSKEQILELLVLEQFLASLPPDLQGWIRDGGPDTCSQAVALVEDFLRPLKEEEEEEDTETLDSEEQPLSDAEGKVIKETPENCDMEVELLDGGNRRPCLPGSTLLERQGTVEAGQRESAANPNEARGVAPLAVAPTAAQPKPPITFWQVQQENWGNVIGLGDGKETRDKTMNPQLERKKPGDAPSTALQENLGNVMVKEESEERRCELEPQSKRSLVNKTECAELSEMHADAPSPDSIIQIREKMPLFSKYGRKYRYVSEFDAILADEAHDGPPPASEGTVQRKEARKTLRGERRFSLTKYERRDSVQAQLWARAQEPGAKSDGFGVGFSFAEPLQSNPGTQSKVKPYQCWQCGKHFKSRDSVNRHGIVHTEDKPFGCPHCSKFFRYKRDFDRHQVTHTRVKPFQCPECDRWYSRKDSLAFHRRSHQS